MYGGVLGFMSVLRKAVLVCVVEFGSVLVYALMLVYVLECV